MLIFACNKRNHQNKNDMKHIITKVFLLLLLAVADMAKAQSFQPYKSGVIPYHGYAYPIVPGTETWKQIVKTPYLLRHQNLKTLPFARRSPPLSR